MRLLLLLLFSLFSVFSFRAHAQSVVRGRVVQASDRQALASANVVLKAVGDSSLPNGTTTNAEGRFTLSVPPGRYRFQVSYIGFSTFDTLIQLGESPLFLRGIALKEDSRLLKEVKIEGVQERVSQQGDTTSINADAFKVNRDANADQLVAKMPGITIENGTVKAQGEDVRRVLVDGQEFFGEDAMLALRSLPAEIVDKVQVFDRLSDQAQFTGFNDGNTEKTLNITTKNGRNSGLFGRAYAGYGTDQRYQAGGNLNSFKGSRRITLLAQSNNTNQMNFSSQDLLGLSAGNSGGRGGMRGGGGRPGGGNFGGGSSNNFMVGQQAGINQTNAIGLNYSDSWGKKIKLSGSYFLNATDNTTDQYLNRQFYQTDGLGPTYTESNLSNAINQNHRFNLRMEYILDTNNSIIFTPRFNVQLNDRANELAGSNANPMGQLLNTTLTNTQSDQLALSGNAEVLWRHRLRKAGRTLSVNLNYGINDREGDGSLYALNRFVGPPDSLVVLDQRSENASLGRTFSTNIQFTEPLGEKGQLSVGYQPSINLQNSEQYTRNYDSLSNSYSVVDSQLSNQFDNTQLTQRVTFNYRFRTEKWRGGVGLNLQHTRMESAQIFPLQLEVNRNFRNLLPNAMLQYSFSQQANLRIFYRTSTNLPSLSQLQNVVDNSNPLQLSIGNPDLVQEFSNFVVLRYNLTQSKTGRSLSVFAIGNVTANALASSTTIASSDTVVNGVALSRGGRLSRPVNLAGAWNSRGVITYGLPIKALKSNLNLNAGLSYNQTPGLVNGAENFARTTTISGGFVLGSNISPEIDFNLSYTTGINRVINSLDQSLNANYVNQLAGLRANWQPTRKWMLSSEWAYTHYSGLDAGIDPDFLLWNAGIGYRLGKNGDGEIRISTFDVLGQNQAIGRTVSDVYVDDTRTSVLQRYFLLTLTWNIRRFKG